MKEKLTKKWLLILCIIFICLIFICLWINKNTGLKAFEKEVSRIEIPQNVEMIAMKSGIGDSGGNGDYSTYRVVLVVKTDMSIDDLKKEYDNKEMTSLTHKLNSGLPYVYITKFENNVFKSARNFKIIFDDLEKTEDYSDYYYIEFIK